MQTAYTLVTVRCQRFAERVVGMRGDERHAAGKPDHDGRVVKIPRRPAQLHEVAYFQFFGRNFFRERSRARTDRAEKGRRFAPVAAVVCQKTVKILHARPRRRSVVHRTVKPARNGGIVHRLAPREQALRGEIRTIAAD